MDLETSSKPSETKLHHELNKKLSWCWQTHATHLGQVAEHSVNHLVS